MSHSTLTVLNSTNSIMVDSSKIISLKAELAASLAQLSGNELRRRDKQEFLASKGYMLRPRFWPG